MNASYNIDWTQIDHVFFDMDGTLLDLHFDNYFWLIQIPIEYAHKMQRTDLEAVKEELVQLIMSKKGQLEWYCLDFWEAELGLDIMGIKRELVEKIQPLPHAMAFLEYLSRQPCDIWLTTNAHRKGVELKFETVPIEPYFKHVVSSHDYGYAKESPHFWERLRAQHPFDPERVVFFDDSLPVIQAAYDAGIHTSVLMLAPDTTKPSVSYDGDHLSIESFQPFMQ
ncbi:MAG: HAD-IA family hydrolase [Pseudomonadota bacterium]